MRVLALTTALSALHPISATAEDAASANNGANAQLEEVVVTAMRRSEDIRDVPLSVLNFTSAQIDDAHVTTVKGLTAIAPQLGVVNSIGESFGQLLRVRGVATSGADIGLESATGVIVDDVPISRPNLALGDFLDVTRVELLEGPQGTLFGKNTTAGVIRVFTQPPAFEPAFELSATAGNFSQGRARVAATGSLSVDTLAGRLDALYSNIGGYLEDSGTKRRYGGRRHVEVRPQLLWTPRENLTLRVIGDWFDHTGSINAPVYRTIGPTGAIIQALSGKPLVAQRNAADKTAIDAASPRFERDRSSALSVEANWHAGTENVAAILSYRVADFDRSYDVDNSPADLVRDPNDGERYRTMTAEFHAQARSGRLDHLVGAFYSHERIVSRDSYRFGTSYESYVNALASGAIPLFTLLASGTNFPAGDGIRDLFTQREQSYAFFTHEIYDFTDKLSLGGGLRYTHITKSLDVALTSVNPGCSAAVARFGPALTGVPDALKPILCIPNGDVRYDGRYHARHDESALSGTASAEYRLNEALNAYATYSHGYKAGGFQLDRSEMNPLAPALSQLAFHPEMANSYEVGLKAVYLGGRLRANAAAFDTAFHNYQFSYLSGTNRQTRNVPELRTTGAEVDATYGVTGLVLTLAVSYQDVKFGDKGFPAGLTQLEGTRGPIAPLWVLFGSASYERPIPGHALTAFGYVDLRWQSNMNASVSATVSPQFEQPAYALVGARLGLQTEDDRWQIAAWGRNIFDTHAWSILTNTTLQPGSISGYVIDPRTFGLTVTTRW